MSQDLLQVGRAVLAAQPLSALLGLQLLAYAASETVIAVDLRPELTQQAGYAHGGVLSTLADVALTFAGGAALGPSVLTAGFTITFLRPAQGQRLIARAGVIDATSRQAVCRCDIFTERDAQEYLAATALGTIRVGGPSAS